MSDLAQLVARMRTAQKAFFAARHTDVARAKHLAVAQRLERLVDDAVASAIGGQASLFEGEGEGDGLYLRGMAFRPGDVGVNHFVAKEVQPIRSLFGVRFAGPFRDGRVVVDAATHPDVATALLVLLANDKQRTGAD